MTYDQYGTEDVLQLTDQPVPKVGPSEVRIRVTRASVNPVDWKVMSGGLEALMETQFPVVPGWDVAGVVESVKAAADVAEDAVLGAGTKVWHLAQVREQARLGERCIVGRAAYIGTGVELGDDCKVQNLALVYEPARLGRGVFIGPGVVLTNDTYPRAVNPDLSQKSGDDWDAVGVDIGDGAAIGARSVCVAPVRIGAWALVAAGSVVTRRG